MLEIKIKKVNCTKIRKIRKVIIIGREHMGKH